VVGWTELGAHAALPAAASSARTSER
jgi:hypothetical protein